MMPRRRIHAVFATILGIGFVVVVSARLHHQGLARTLIEAVDAQDRVSVTAALDRGASVNARDEHGDTALMHAVGRGDRSIVELLLDRGADVNASGRDRLTALMWAVRDGWADTVELLVQRGADVNATDYNGDTALMLFEAEPMRSPVQGAPRDKISRLLKTQNVGR